MVPDSGLEQLTTRTWVLLGWIVFLVVVFLTVAVLGRRRRIRREQELLLVGHDASHNQEWFEQLERDAAQEQPVVDAPRRRLRGRR